MSQPSQITWANTGALSNLCYFLRMFPDALTKIKQIVIMGGSTGRGNITPAAQFNVYFDPYAFEEVLSLKKDVPLVMVPLDTTSEVLCKDDVFQYLEARKNIPLDKALYEMLRSYQIMYKRAYGDVEYPIIHDPCVIYYILHPEKYNVKDVINYFKHSVLLLWIFMILHMEGLMFGIIIQSTPRRNQIRRIKLL